MMKRTVIPVLLLILTSPEFAAAQSPALSGSVAERPPELSGKLNAALAAQGAHYQPRTEHLLPDGTPRFTNRLILEDSPYLLQHAHNPVDWYPWGAEAFVRAREENKPVFLSIGYSTCHWCHVMERESFDNLEIAEFMNRHFISIKVDRERRPDVDTTYMTGVLLVTGHGGWPLNSFLTPGGKTFFGGTYYPPGHFTQLLQAITSAWDERQDELLKQADLIGNEVRKFMHARQESLAIDHSMIRSAVKQILARFDGAEGGFSSTPKFPNEPILLLLLDAAVRYPDTGALEAVLVTLRKMAQGGIHDQIGGGFHRYATDQHWLVPHFEKMLYNQANLARIYLEAHALTGDIVYARVATRTLDYVLREMTAANGGFYSATDADSEGEEGRYFLWTVDQVHRVLGPGEEADFVTGIYGMTETGNFNGGNILHLPVPLNEYADNNGLGLPVVLDRVDRAGAALLRARGERVPPLRDEKIVSAWNGMMITALARAGRVLNEPRYLEAAVKAAEFIWRENRNPDDTLWRSNLDGRVSVAAGQEDYACYAEALIALYDVTGATRWLERAQAVTRRMLALFWDAERYGFYMSSGASGAPIMARPKDTYDAAVPSGNSIAMRVLAKLARRSADYTYENHAAKTLVAFSHAISKQPASVPYMILAASEHLHGEQGARQYAARGHVITEVTLEETRDKRVELDIQLAIQPGWHINANRTLNSDLVPTQVLVQDAEPYFDVTRIVYPHAAIKTLGFSKDRLALYEGTVHIEVSLQPTGGDSGSGMMTLPVTLKLQACNDDTCLPPEAVRFNVPAVSIHPAVGG